MVYGDSTYSGVVPASGTLEIKITPQGRQTWTVSQVSIRMDSAPGATTCQMYKNAAPVTPLVPNSDAAGGDPPVQLRPGDKLRIVWSNATPGLVGTVFLIYDDGT